MAKILTSNNVITVGGLQPYFKGVQVGEFELVPDSDSGTRPNTLKVEGPKEVTLLLHSGTCLTVEIASEGVFRGRYLRYLSFNQMRGLEKLASNLTGRLLPMAGYNLQKQVEELGEGEIVSALRNLFKGVVEVERRRRVPFFGKYFGGAVFPAR